MPPPDLAAAPEPRLELADSHCHLQLLKQHLDAAQALQLAREQGVEQCLCVSVQLSDYPEILDLCSRHSGLLGSVGIHPNYQADQDTEQTEPDSDQLAQKAADPRVAAIGETGLDYYRGEQQRELQQQRFRMHVRAARTARKPLIIHSRQARGDVLDILREEQAREVGGVMHCFVDDWETAKQAMDINFYISFSGIVTFKNASELRQVAQRIPLDRLLIETDAPYLAPVPHRGQYNQPAYLRHTAEQLAALRGETLQTLAEATTRNYGELFHPARARGGSDSRL